MLVPGTEKTSRFLEGNLVYAVGKEDLEGMYLGVHEPTASSPGPWAPLGGVSPYSITSWIYLVHSLIYRVHVGPEVNYVGLTSHCSEEK